MRIIDIALKDLYQMVQDKRSLLFLVAMPIVMTFFMALAYKTPQDGAAADQRLALAWVDNDPGSGLGQALAADLDGSASIRLEPMDEAAGREAARKGEAAGVLIVPAGFSHSRLRGGASQLILVVDPGTTRGQSLIQGLRRPVTRLMSALEIARLSAEAIDRQKPLDSAGWQAEFQAALQVAGEKWAAAGSADLVRVQAANVPAERDPYGGNPYNQASPGILVMFAIFGLTTSAQILVQERKLRTLERMMTTSLSPAEAVGGHFLAMFSLAALQQLLLVGFGQVVLGVNYLGAPLGALAVIAALSLCTASLGLLVGVAVRGEDQAVLISMIAMFVFSALGGAWFPLEGAGKTFATIGRLTPIAWAMNGFQNILIRGLDSASALLPSAVLLLYAAGFFLLAAWRFKKTA